MPLVFFVLLVGFELKHFVADYLLQTGWMIAGKGDLRAFGGYAHAGVHLIGSAIVFIVVGNGLVASILILAAEFVVHYGLDFAKAYYGRGVSAETNTQLFWAQHGFDQLMHQLTYAAMIYFATRA